MDVEMPEMDGCEGRVEGATALLARLEPVESIASGTPA